MSVRLSVIIPGYRTPDAVWRRCVESVLCNLGDDDEVICVDDASPAFPQALDVLGREDGRISVVRLPENRGQAYARNAGLERARGRYAAFVDSDDELLPGIYAKAISAIECDGTDVAVYGVRTVWFRDSLLRNDSLPRERLGVLDAKSLRRLLDARLFNYPWNKIYRKDFLDANGIRFVEKCIPREDEAFNLDCAIARAAWTVLPDIGHVYYHQSGTSLSRYRRYAVECEKIVARRWMKCRAVLRDADGLLSDRGNLDEARLLRIEWENMWRRETPYSMLERWRWLAAHRELGGVFRFLGTWMFSFCRAHFYFRPVRRWHIKKTAKGRLEEMGGA